jgi:hypothetical protein
MSLALTPHPTVPAPVPAARARLRLRAASIHWSTEANVTAAPCPAFSPGGVLPPPPPLFTA